MKQLEMLYEGKAKQVFRTDDPDKIIIHYKDAATAFNITMMENVTKTVILIMTAFVTKIAMEKKTTHVK